MPDEEKQFTNKLESKDELDSENKLDKKIIRESELDKKVINKNERIKEIESYKEDIKYLFGKNAEKIINYLEEKLSVNEIKLIYYLSNNLNAYTISQVVNNLNLSKVGRKSIKKLLISLEELVSILDFWADKNQDKLILLKAKLGLAETIEKLFEIVQKEKENIVEKYNLNREIFLYELYIKQKNIKNIELKENEEQEKFYTIKYNGKEYKIYLGPNTKDQIKSLIIIKSCLSFPFGERTNVSTNILKHDSLKIAVIKDGDKIIGRFTLCEGYGEKGENRIARLSKVYQVAPIFKKEYIEKKVDEILEKYAKEKEARFIKEGEIIIPNIDDVPDDFVKWTEITNIKESLAIKCTLGREETQI